MKTQTNKPNGPDMTGVQKKELKALRAEELRLVRRESALVRRLVAMINRHEKAAEKLVKRLYRKAEMEVKLVEVEAAKAVKPLRKELARRTQGKVKHERLAAVRHRIAILEGRGA